MLFGVSARHCHHEVFDRALPYLADHRPRLTAALAEGAAYYRDFGTGRSRGTKPIQLGGNIKRGALIERAFGLSLREIVEEVDKVMAA